MKFQVKISDVLKVESDLLAVFANTPPDKESGDVDWTPEAQTVSRTLGGALTEIAQTEHFDGALFTTVIIHTHGKIPAKRIMVAGLGVVKDLTMEHWQSLLAHVTRAAQLAGVKKLAIAVPSIVLTQLDTKDAFQGVVEGVALGSYRFDKFKNTKDVAKKTYIEEVSLLTTANKLDAASLGTHHGEVVSEAVLFARDLVNEPPSVTTPTYLANVAQGLAKGQKNITCTVFGRKDMKTMGMGALLGIAQGSDEEPKFIKLEYNGQKGTTVALLGKGITFDTGGLSLKPSDGMETMKLDMSGAATILGIFKVLSRLQPKVNVVGIIAATENMPGSSAVKPGDIVTAMNGKTIEILNTDAEGRVILADALSYTTKHVKANVIIDLATLTGACMVALGHHISGLFSTDQKLADGLKKSAQKTGEKIWELPLAEEFSTELKSSLADVKNISGTRYGGAISGAMFLKEFVPDGVPWAHLDIAGPAFAEKDMPLTPKGGTGFGVRMLLHYLLS